MEKLSWEREREREREREEQSKPINKSLIHKLVFDKKNNWLDNYKNWTLWYMIILKIGYSWSLTHLLLKEFDVKVKVKG